MSDAPPTTRELDDFREQADRFIAQLDEEFYLHYAGLKETLDVEPIYERHANVTTLATAQRIGRGVNGGSGVRELWRFACEGYLGNLTKQFDARVAELEATVDGEPVRFRELRPATMNAGERDRRARLDAARCALTDEHLNPVLLDAARTAHAAVRDLGARSYRDLYIEGFKFDLEGLADQAR